MGTLLRPVLLLAAAAVAAAGCGGDPRPLVATREGLVRGVTQRSAAGNPFHSFKGIPYARPPLGALRFQPPQRHPGWTDIRDALDHGSRCLQFDFLKNFTQDGSEDCLFANVYTPQLPDLRGAVGGLPVMVFIHGGGFMSGHGDAEFFGPSYIVDDGVVLVTFNYRLGPFGFFTTHDSSAPGNYGLLDQVLLLKWVRDNIANFGGDPESVTIFGVSAGGASVSLLVLSPLTKGLFHHAISQSGAALSIFAAGGRRKGSAEKFAEHVNCSSQDSASMVECIRREPAGSIMRANMMLDVTKQHFYPRVDPEAEFPLIPEDPHILLESGRFNLVPWMNGFTEEEGSFFIPSLLADKAAAHAFLSGNLTQWGKSIYITTDSESRPIDCDADQVEEIAKVHSFYSVNGLEGSNGLLALARVFGDHVFLAPASEEIRLASLHTPVYKYVLDHTGPGRLSLSSLIGFEGPDFGATHADDILYLFSNKLGLEAADSPAYTMIRFMVSVWTSFARAGRPGSDVLAMPDWPIFTEQSQRHMRLNSEPSLGERLYDDRVRFWQTVRVNEPWRHAVQTACPPQPEAGAGYR